LKAYYIYCRSGFK